MHTAFVYYLSLLIIVLFVVMLARRLRLSYPLVLVCSGLAISFIPGLPAVQMNPEYIFLIFLPPLLYEAAWSTSWKEFWKWRRVISSFAFGIVILTACIVAFLSHAVIPGFTLAAGFLLGGIVSPTDAVAATTVLNNLKVPKRTLSILEGESLMNDATSLVIYQFALAAAVSGTFVLREAAMSFAVVISMGIAVGLGVAFAYYAIHRWMPTTASIDTILTFTAPYTMYVIADQLHFSGVLAVVSGGLFLSGKRHIILTNVGRIQAANVWSAIVFVLNALTFIFIGLEFPETVRQLGSTSLHDAIIYGLIISGVLIVSRLIFTLGASVFTRLISNVITTADSNPGWRGPVLFGWAGMRGVVSLAAALSVPLLLSNGKAFPQRDIILFITFVVIIVTLVLQGFTLPWLVRRLAMEETDYPMTDQEQELIIRNRRADVVLTMLNQNYRQDVTANLLLQGMQFKAEKDHEFLSRFMHNLKGDSGSSVQTLTRFKDVAFELLKQQRLLLEKFNNKAEFDENIIRQQLGEIDLEEEKLNQHFSEQEQPW